MSKQESASLAVKIIAIYIVVNAVVSTSLDILPYVQSTFFAATQGVGPNIGFDSIPNMVGRELLSIIFPVGIAVILWLISNWLGSKMVNDTKPQHTHQTFSAIELQTILISVIGLFVTISAIPQLVAFFTALSLPSIPGANFSAIILQLINPLLAIIMGWFLLFNAAKISRFLQKERS
jgi:hypothetical protein